MTNTLIKYGQCKNIGCAWPLNEDKTCDKCDIDPCEQGHDYNEDGYCTNCGGEFQPDDFSGATEGDR